MFYIYHIPERNKIGVSNNLKVRMRKHKWTGSYEILEEHDCIYKVSDREVELQIEYYGKRDNNLLYWQTVKAITPEGRRKGGLSHSKEFFSEIGKKSKPTDNQIQCLLDYNKRKRKLDYQTAEYIRAQYKRGKDVFGKKISQRRLAGVFGVGLYTIQLILNNTTYTTP